MRVKEFTFVHVLGILILVIFAVVGLAMYASAKQHEALEEVIENTDLSQCDVVGNAVDSRNGGGRKLRDIYHCDDGSIYIR